jgi:hypothetical protein
MCAFRAGSFAIFRYLHIKLWVLGLFLKPHTHEGRNMLAVFYLDFDLFTFGAILVFDFVFFLLLPVPTGRCRCPPVCTGTYRCQLYIYPLDGGCRFCRSHPVPTHSLEFFLPQFP